MSGIVIVGTQWGDEGKGKIVDILTENADVVVRYSGGPNAGHTLVVPNDKGGHNRIVVRLVPSGIIRPGIICVLGCGMVVDPLALSTELDQLVEKGVWREGDTRLILSERAQMILPYHTLIDGLREQGSFAVGTTKRGIGPAYEDKARRNGVHLHALSNLPRMERHVTRALAGWEPFFKAYNVATPSPWSVVESIAPAAERLKGLLGDASETVTNAISAGKNVIFEGAQGTLLDVDHGTYPFVTSSSAVAGGACGGVGVGPTSIQRVAGITKAYTTRVGGGPFPTEDHGERGVRLREAGGEFGSVTGRPRRCGWLDFPALRYAARVNGLTDLIVTKLDVLSGFSEIPVCVGYDTPDGRTNSLPIEDIDKATPIYETMPGWGRPLDSIRSLADLPTETRRYLDRIEHETSVPLSMVSVGPEREATIILRNFF